VILEMPMIRCPHCKLRQYAPATHATIPECAGCGRPFAVERATQIAPVVAAEREAHGGSRRRVAPDRPGFRRS
jgi:DNA-directed RNA polymerase subunit RPC12/RpoP